MTHITVLFLLFSLVALNAVTGKQEQHYNISQAQWEKEYKNGEWGYLDRVGIERARNAVIVNLFYAMYGGGAYGSLASVGETNGIDSKDKSVKRILDVGCGLGTLSDYLHGPQRAMYLGLDLSEEAVKMARTIRSPSGRERGGGMPPLQVNQFMQTESSTWKPPNGEKYGTIIFNEMLYYVNHKEVMKHYAQFLEPEGIIVVSVWFQQKYVNTRK